MPAAPLPIAEVAADAPLILVFRRFLSENECATLLSISERAEFNSDQADPAIAANDSAWTPAEQQLLADIEDRIGHVTGCAPHDEELPLLLLHRAPAASKHPTPSRFPAGLHVDTNCCYPRRYASALLYISTPKAGGTVFPLAGAASAAPSLAASRELLHRDVHHTRSAIDAATLTMEAAARRAPSSSSDGRGHRRRFFGCPVGPDAHATSAYAANAQGVAVRAQAGNLAVFWTRQPTGIDERSWHAGEAVAYGSTEDKWLLRKFKEIPKAVYDDPQARAAFVDGSLRAGIASSLSVDTMPTRTATALGEVNVSVRS